MKNEIDFSMTKKFIKPSVLNFSIFQGLKDSDKLKKIREILNLTQSKFSFELKIGREAIAQIEADYNNISAGMEDKLNELFFYDSRFNDRLQKGQTKNDDLQIVTDEYCIDFLKKTGKYNIYKITETAL